MPLFLWYQEHDISNRSIFTLWMSCISEPALKDALCLHLLLTCGMSYTTVIYISKDCLQGKVNTRKKNMPVTYDRPFLSTPANIWGVSYGTQVITYLTSCLRSFKFSPKAIRNISIRTNWNAWKMDTRRKGELSAPPGVNKVNYWDTHIRICDLGPSGITGLSGWR